MNNTVNLFWTPHHLEAFQQAWDNNEYDPDWIGKIYQQGIQFSHRKTEVAVDADIERLFKAARSGCNLTLTREFQRLHDKWSDNDKACDCLATAWDCISTAQCKLARRWGVYIEWSDINEWSDD